MRRQLKPGPLFPYARIAHEKGPGWLDAGIPSYIAEEAELAEEIEEADESRGVIYAAIIKAEKACSKPPSMPLAGTSDHTPSAGTTPSAKGNCV